jgi:pimeloyl-ACP methyl ester carboxylesterase
MTDATFTQRKTITMNFKLAVSLLAVSAAAISAPASAETVQKPAIVLVHGAFANASSWAEIVPILQRSGYEVTAVEGPLQSLESDVEWTKRVIDAQARPVVLVGHSYGGGVITGAAAGNPKVKALVYIAAFAPDDGEPLGAFGEKYPVALGAALRADAAGFLTVDRQRFRELFAADLPEAQTAVLAASQKPIAGNVFSSSVPWAAWKTIPSWYLLTTQDRALHPDHQRFYARRSNAKVIEVKSSHVPFLTHSAEVARVIVEAASTPTK